MRVTVNVLWNMLGTGIPLLGLLVAVPPLIEAMGVERFGVLSLAWITVGYFSLFDLGLGRAMTQLIAQKIGTGKHSEIPSIVRSGMALITVLGIVGGFLAAGLVPWLVGSKLAISESLRSETLASFFLLSASIPIVIVSAGLRGIFEGWQRFDVVNLVRAPLGLLTYVGPLFVLPYSNALPPVVGVLVIGRLASCVAFAVICLRLYPEITGKSPIDTNQLRRLLSFGGWMTLSNIAGPLLLYLGRFALALLVSAEAVAYFSTPYDVVISILLIPGVFVSVLFPMFAERFQQNRDSARRLYFQWLLYTFLAVFPFSLMTYLFAEPVLAWWINHAFSQNSFRVAQLLAIGVFINSFGLLSQALVQAYGRPDLTAKLHVAELIAYVPYMWWLVERSGVEGAAIAWVVRVAISTFALAILAYGCQTGVIRQPHTDQRQ